MTAKEITEAIFAEWQASCARYPEGYPSPLGPIVERHIAAIIDERDNFQQSVCDLTQACKDANEDLAQMTAIAYHTAPGEMEFGGEGWTWKQQARADHDRLIAAEKEIEELDRLLKEYERKDATT